MEIFENYNKYKENIDEGKEEMPLKVEHDSLVYIRAGQIRGVWKYNIFFKGHDIEDGGVKFRSKKELEEFMGNYTISIQMYNKLKYKDSKKLPIPK